MHGLCDDVAALMREVGTRIMMPRFRQLRAEDIAEKTPGDPVTIVDRESEAFLTEKLAALMREARVVGEEATAADPTLLDGLGEGTAWIIDPLDGTKNFSEGHPPFAIMIALVSDGEREASWILDPVSGRLCHAARGGAFIDGERVWARPSGNSLPLAAAAVYFMTEARRADIVERARGALALVDIPRCAGEQYPRIVLGRNDIALFERTLPWDHAPGALFLEEAGGRIARPDGSPYRVGVPGTGMIGAASPALWDEAARILFG
ncbi:inositol monophosphatase family protein [Flavisphingomonas formosensis]|uniref:inositol monophosphatase family protein n=1 Tax=Flavisphingomonas formosensis TaxID=861534 RepID=UPI0012FBD3AE|nr:inositol monophosphatase family protein [Sphingomonas formosensis]